MTLKIMGYGLFADVGKYIKNTSPVTAEGGARPKHVLLKLNYSCIQAARVVDGKDFSQFVP